MRDARTDSLDENGALRWEGSVDVLARLHDRRLVLYYGEHVGRPILSGADVGREEAYRIDPAAFADFAEGCRLTAANEGALSRLTAEIAQDRRAPDPAALVVNVDL